MYSLTLFVLSTVLIAVDAATVARDSITTLGSRDVCILGGGAAGTYAAVKLIDGGAAGTYAAVKLIDEGKSVALLEKTDRLGGNCKTHYVGKSKSLVDISPEDQKKGLWVPLGVIVFCDDGRGQLDFLDRFGIKTDQLPLKPLFKVRDVDFFEGIRVGFQRNRSSPGWSSGPMIARSLGFVGGMYYGLSWYGWIGAAVGGVMGGWITETVLGFPLDFGLAMWRLMRLFETPDLAFYKNFTSWPDEIPTSLQVPWRDFQEKHELQSIHIVTRSWAGGFDVMNTPTYALLMVVRPFLMAATVPLYGTGRILPTQCDSLYDKLASFLDDSVFYNISVTRVTRPVGDEATTNTTITYTVGNEAEDEDQTVECGSVMVAFDQHLASLGAFDLDEGERAVFGSIQPNSYSTAALRYKKASAKSAVDTLLWAVDSTANKSELMSPSGNRIALVQNIHVVNDTTVYSNVQFTHNAADYPHNENGTVERIATELGNYDGVKEGSVEIMECVRHELGYFPTTAAVKDGFYGKMNRLQGHRGTYWIGSAISFDTHGDCWQHAGAIVDLHLTSLAANVALANATTCEMVA